MSKIFIKLEEVDNASFVNVLQSYKMPSIDINWERAKFNDNVDIFDFVNRSTLLPNLSVSFEDDNSQAFNIGHELLSHAKDLHAGRILIGFDLIKQILNQYVRNFAEDGLDLHILCHLTGKRIKMNDGTYKWVLNSAIIRDWMSFNIECSIIHPDIDIRHINIKHFQGLLTRILTLIMDWTRLSESLINVDIKDITQELGCKITYALNKYVKGSSEDTLANKTFTIFICALFDCVKSIIDKEKPHKPNPLMDSFKDLFEGK